MKNLVDSTTKFAPVDMWAKIPMGVTFRGDATSIAVDSEDNVYVFNRGNYPIAVFDKDGDFIRGFGHGDFVRPHGIEIDLDDNIYLVDDDGHFIQKRNNDGEILFTLGEKGKPCKWQSGGMFNRPTDIAIHPINRDLFISANNKSLLIPIICLKYLNLSLVFSFIFTFMHHTRHTWFSNLLYVKQ